MTHKFAHFLKIGLFYYGSFLFFSFLSYSFLGLLANFFGVSGGMTNPMLSFAPNMFGLAGLFVARFLWNKFFAEKII
ncbi:MAG: hypothetical protein BWY78_00975 [Alphaproteobacteria bacterium ADurb.Bin438]|nr:MAG: hypothetical protein BWY78_00975 [Alphaproteobacteria bacterium ADurb.Bin438]